MIYLKRFLQEKVLKVIYYLPLEILDQVFQRVGGTQGIKTKQKQKTIKKAITKKKKSHCGMNHKNVFSCGDYEISHNHNEI